MSQPVGFDHVLPTLATLLVLQFLDELVSSVVQMKQNFLKCFNFIHERNLMNRGNKSAS